MSLIYSKINITQVQPKTLLSLYIWKKPKERKHNNSQICSNGWKSFAFFF